MDLEPLHVRVARALGCKPEWKRERWTCPCPRPAGWIDPYSMPKDARHIWHWQDRPTGSNRPAEYREIAGYDLSWYATGPLIEKYGLQLGLGYKLSDPPQRGGTWIAIRWDYTLKGFPGEHVFADGETPLVATCNLILALKEAGKL